MNQLVTTDGAAILRKFPWSLVSHWLRLGLISWLLPVGLGTPTATNSETSAAHASCAHCTCGLTPSEFPSRVPSSWRFPQPLVPCAAVVVGLRLDVSTNPPILGYFYAILCHSMPTCIILYPLSTANSLPSKSGSVDFQVHNYGSKAIPVPILSTGSHPAVAKPRSSFTLGLGRKSSKSRGGMFRTSQHQLVGG